MRLAIIAAVARNRVIGSKGRLPWRIPEDLARFRRLTTGHAVLMGRRTHEAIGRPLPWRRNIVLGGSPIPDTETYGSLETALAALREEELVFVIGGASLFGALLLRANLLYLTLVDASPDGDTFFPPYEHLLGTAFRRTAVERHKGFRFEDYIRVHQSSFFDHQ